MADRRQSQDKQFDILILKTMTIYHIPPLSFSFFVWKHDKNIMKAQ